MTKRRKEATAEPKRKHGTKARSQVDRRHPQRRSVKAVDWVAGIAREDIHGYAHIELPLAIHHDQARAAFRAREALIMLGDAGLEMRERVILAAMPVSRQDASAIKAELTDVLRTNDGPIKTAMRIGLGFDTKTAREEIPATFTDAARTKRDGTPKEEITADSLAYCDNDGIHSRDKSDENAPSIREMTDAANAPRWAAGIGPEEETPGIPDITKVLAVGHTKEETAGRAIVVGSYLDDLSDAGTKFAVLPVARNVGQRLQDAFVNNYPDVTDNQQELIKVSSGVRTEPLSNEQQDHASGLAAQESSDGDATLGTNDDGATALWRHGRRPPESNDGATGAETAEPAAEETGGEDPPADPPAEAQPAAEPSGNPGDDVDPVSKTPETITTEDLGTLAGMRGTPLGTPEPTPEPPPAEASDEERAEPDTKPEPAAEAAAEAAAEPAAGTTVPATTAEIREMRAKQTEATLEGDYDTADGLAARILTETGTVEVQARNNAQSTPPAIGKQIMVKLDPDKRYRLMTDGTRDLPEPESSLFEESFGNGFYNAGLAVAEARVQLNRTAGEADAESKE